MEFQGGFDDLARMNCGFINRSKEKIALPEESITRG